MYIAQAHPLELGLRPGNGLFTLLPNQVADSISSASRCRHFIGFAVDHHLAAQAHREASRVSGASAFFAPAVSDVVCENKGTRKAEDPVVIDFAQRRYRPAVR